MAQVKPNDRVTLEYQGTLADGEIFDSSEESGPLTFTVGDGTLPPYLERAVIGMAVDQTRQILVTPEEAFGPRRPELVVDFPRRAVALKELSPGMVIGMNMEREGKTVKVPAQVVTVGEDTVTLDFNHPLAGQELNYTLTVRAIHPPGSDHGA